MLNDKFESVSEAIQAVKSRADDVDSVTVFLTRALAGDEGQDFSDVGMVLSFCTGRHGIVSKSLAVHLLNDGVFNRMRIPVHFV